MMRQVQWLFDDTTNTLTARLLRQDGTGADVVWSTTDTTPPAPWIEPPFPPAE